MKTPDKHPPFPWPALDKEDVRRLKRFAAGGLTWAEVEGISAAEALQVARAGCALAAAGRLEEALLLFEGLVECNPHDSASRAALGTVYQRLGRVADALVQYDAALVKDPLNPTALANRGELHLRQGHRQGIADLALAAKVDPHGETPGGRRAKAWLQALERAAAQKVRAPSA